MIEAVGTSTIQGSALRSQPQANASAVAAASGEVAKISGAFVSSRVRVDNLHNVAVLEFRNSGGEVIRQYPSKAELQGYARAASLQSKSSSSSSSDTTPSAPVADEGGSDQAAAAPSVDAAPAPSPAPAAPPSGGSASTTQSVVV